MDWTTFFMFHDVIYSHRLHIWYFGTSHGCALFIDLLLGRIGGWNIVLG
jgi:hypothetical protein